MQERAIRDRWPMSADVRVKVLKRLCKIVDEDAEHEAGPPGHREIIAASRALLSADKLNLEYQKFEAEQTPEKTSIADAALDDAEAALDIQHPEQPAGDEVQPTQGGPGEVP